MVTLEPFAMRPAAVKVKTEIANLFFGCSVIKNLSSLRQLKVAFSRADNNLNRSGGDILHVRSVRACGRFSRKLIQTRFRGHFVQVISDNR